MTLRRLIAAALCCLGAATAFTAVGAGSAVAVPENTELCEPGYYSSTGLVPCKAAPPGTYAQGLGAHAATPCAAGTYNPFAAADECSPADPGYFVALPQATTQAPCTPGTFTSAPGASLCSPAPAGHYVPNSAEPAATPCPAGQYQPSTGQTSCLQASPGSYVGGPGQAGQLPCLPGSYQPSAGQSSCKLAGLGYYVSVAGAVSETACPAGMTTAGPGANSEAACFPKPLEIVIGNLREATRGTSCSFQLLADGGTAPYTWKKVGKLPKGLKLSKSGLLSGTPGKKLLPGNYFPEVQVKDAAKHVVKATLMIVIH